MLCAVQVILQEADFANNDHLQETIEAAQVRPDIVGYIFIKSIWRLSKKWIVASATFSYGPGFAEIPLYYGSGSCYIFSVFQDVNKE